MNEAFFTELRTLACLLKKGRDLSYEKGQFSKVVIDYPRMFQDDILKNLQEWSCDETSVFNSSIFYRTTSGYWYTFILTDNGASVMKCIRFGGLTPRRDALLPVLHYSVGMSWLLLPEQMNKRIPLFR